MGGERDVDALRVLFEHAPVAQFVSSSDGAILVANAAYAALVGAPVDEVIGSVPSDVTHPDDLPRLLRQGAQLLAGELDVIDVELRVRTAGGFRWCLATCSLARGSTGEPLFVSQILDVHDRRRAEADLAASQARFRVMADSVPVGIQQRDPDGRLVYVNRRWTEITGLSEDEALGAAHVELIHPEDRAHVVAAGQRLAAEGGPYHEQYRIVRPDGAVRWVSGRSAAVLGPDGEVSAYVGSLEDVTTLIEAQEQVNRLAGIAERTGDLVGVVDAHGWVVWANEAARVTHGISADRLPIHSSKLYTQESIERFLGHILPALERGDRWMGELDMVSADGEVLSIWQSLAPQLDAEGQLISISAVGRDLTDRKRREADLTHRATHDVLTGLPNRALLLDRLQQAVEVVRSSVADEVALLFIDLDRFKKVNDELGHDAGDELLRVVAERLGGALRSVDVIARLGGDEFVVLCPGLGRAEAEDVALRLLDALSSTPVDIGGRRVGVTASVGVTVAAGSRENHAEGLLREADVAMYQAKAHGRNRVEVYDG